MIEGASARLLDCDRAPAEVLASGIGGAILDARAARAAPWSRGDLGLAVARGARGVLLSIEDATPPGHDRVHGVGAHARALGWLRAARAAGLEVAVTTTVTRSSARAAAALSELLGEARVAGWRLALVEPRDREDAAGRSPSLGVCAPHVLRAADRAARLGVEIALEAFPACVLGPFARWQRAQGEAAPGRPCDHCPARTACPGLFPLHRDRFGATELRATTLPAEAPDTPRRDLARALLAPASKTSAD